MNKEFAKKSVEEIKKMTDEERQTYFEQKEAHEKEERKKLIDEAVKEALKGASVSKEDMETFKTQITQMVENVAKGLKDDFQGGVENAVKSLSEKYKNFYENETSADVQADISVAKERDTRAKFSIEHKAFDATNVMTVAGDVGGTQAVSSTYQKITAQVVGPFTKPRPSSKIMNYVSVHPLNAGQLVVFENKVVGDFAVTKECELKPFVKYQETDVTADAVMITALWCTTAKLRRFYPAIANRMQQTLEELLGEAIPNKVLEFTRTSAVAFTPIPALKVFDAPNEYDAIASVVASLKKAGYVPQTLALSPVAYAKLITNKSTDGHYVLQNGTSITLVGDVIKLGSYNINVIEDPKLEDDEFIIGDLSYVNVGIDPQIFYLETDGRVEEDNVVKTGLAVNIRTHELGKFLAMVIADGAKAGIVKDTFTNVKTLIKKGV